MHAMYAKLFSRIAQSSLMEEEVEVRYCFMMLLAIADYQGDVIGTDVAIARTLNLPVETFKRCIDALMKPDPDSNSQVFDGRRVVPSESGRGYLIVNYTTYRDIKNAEEKKTYMREYMRKRRGSSGVTKSNPCKTPLSNVTHTEADTEADTVKVNEALISKRKPKGVDECVNYVIEIGLAKTDGEWFWDKEVGNGWTNGGKAIADWKATMRAWKQQGYFPSQKGLSLFPKPVRDPIHGRQIR